MSLIFSVFSGVMMKYLAAYLLSTMSGNKSPTAKDIEDVLGSVGLDVDMEDANKVVSALSGKSIDEVITAGLAKISSVPSDAAVSAIAPVVSATPTDALQAESKKEEKKEEPKEESDEDMGFGLFD
uniref:Large ribosomal subunit protein P2 n=3 Tax=Brugia TaxID=6278 RepID=A8QCH8_BRUMA